MRRIVLHLLEDCRTQKIPTKSATFPELRNPGTEVPAYKSSTGRQRQDNLSSHYSERHCLKKIIRWTVI